MPRITLKIKNKQVVQSLSVLGESIPGVTKAGLKKEMAQAKKEVATYPPPPSDRYKRTGRYGRGVKLETTKGERTYTLSTRAVYKGRSYAQWVGGDSKGNMQVAVHKRTGWRKLFDAVFDASKRVLATVPSTIKNAIRNAGMGS